MICNIALSEEEFSKALAAGADGIALFEYKDGKPTGKKAVFKPVAVAKSIHKKDDAKQEKKNDDIIPAYYGGEDNAYEAIKVIDAWGLGFSLGNAIKYICRAGKKKDNSRVQDLTKARYYLEHEIKTEKGDV